MFNPNTTAMTTSKHPAPTTIPKRSSTTQPFCRFPESTYRHRGRSCVFRAPAGKILANCGAKEIRTPDLFDANEALYQLSYSPGTGRSHPSSTEPVTLGYKFSRLNAKPARPAGPGAPETSAAALTLLCAAALQDVVEVAEGALSLGQLGCFHRGRSNWRCGSSTLLQ